MQGSGSLLKYWLPAILWMVLIFSGSTAGFSAGHTSRILKPFLRWLNPDISDQTVYRVQFVVRKGCHLAEYSVLGILCWWGWRRPRKGERRPWKWTEAAVALGLAFAYALTDELHQSLVPERQGHPLDVLIDTAGAGLGLIGLYLAGRWRHWWR